MFISTFFKTTFSSYPLNQKMHVHRSSHVSMIPKLHLLLSLPHQNPLVYVDETVLFSLKNFRMYKRWVGPGPDPITFTYNNLLKTMINSEIFLLNNSLILIKTCQGNWVCPASWPLKIFALFIFVLFLLMHTQTK